MRGVRRSALAARQSGPVCRMDSYPRPTEALKREVSAAGGGSLFSIMRGLWPYIWPAERRDLKLRVAVAMLLLLAAKLATIAVPFTFKWATDALVGEGSAPVAPSSWLVWALAAPILLTVAYGGTRILMALLTQMRDGVFAKVAMHAVRRLAYLVFEHMHLLSLRFHLERKTGGLTRVLERGRNAIETIVRMVIVQAVPTVVELALIVGMGMCAFGVQNGTQTIGDLVMINAMMIQLYQPLNFMGMVYREMKQAVIDIETMFGILSRKPEIEDKPDAPPLAVRQGAIRFDNVSFA